MSEPTYAVGIDLGTTHCVMSAARLDRPVVRLQPVPQLVAPGEVGEQPLLPSFLYLPAEGELSAGDRTLPWGASEHVVGELARRLGARVPNRLVASAKSWVCHGGVNRRAPILPWAAPDEEPHVSPFDAQVAYLAHLRAAWNAAHPDAPLADQDVVVTVPASFDEGARELTSQAADAAELGNVRLIEEPQAAFYDFLGAHREDLDARLGDAKLILVVDVGGGTTDLTLLQVAPPGTGQRIERIAVGGHLMLGGDNMDAALAMHALQKANIERPRDATVWSGLVQAARQAKERLLGEDAPESAVLTVQARGSKLIAGTRSIAIDRDEASRVLLDGFLPHTGPNEIGQRAARAGLTTLGLPYTSDVAIGRHVCAFLRRHAAAAIEAGARVDDGLPRPDLLLLNGGVWNAAALVQRLGEVLAGWYGEPVPLLPHTSLETAVAHGAVRSALARRGLGEVIGGGTARAYFIGVAGRDGAAQALCIAPRAMDDGATVEVPNRVFELVIDRAVAFPLYAYTGDRVDAPGELVEVTEELEPLPAMQTVLRDREQRGADTVPVTLKASLTEAGALEVYLVTVALPPRRWRVPFVLASAPVDESDPEDASLSEPAEQIDDANAVLAKLFRSDDDKRIKQIRRDVEQLLGPRGQWSGATCRALWGGCMAVESDRGRSPEHELNWLRLSGWCLRPGFGAPDDEARLDRTWTMRERGLLQATKANWGEWWIAWRRVAPGLDAARQLALFEDIEPWLWRPAKAPSGPGKHGPVEMMQLLAALELLPVDAKVRAGELLLERAKKLGSWWPLGRVGARALLRGDASLVVPPEIATRWLRRVLELDWATAEGAAFAAASIARLTADTARDIDASVRKEVADRLTKAKAPSTFVDMVLRPTALGEGDLRSVLGESLPVGLRLG